MLAKFESSGIIRLTREEGRRKSYRITDAGKEMLKEEYRRLKVMAEDGREWLEDL